MKGPDLADLVDALSAHDASEVRAIARLKDLIAAVAEPWRRDRYEPGHVTASAFVLHPEEAAMALILHSKLDAWLQPGGHVEPEDLSHEAAARREVAEECGLRGLETLGVLDVDIHTFPARTGQPEHLHFDIRWAFRAATDLLEVGDGASAVRWVPLEEAAGMDESIARPARKLRALTVTPNAGYAEQP